MARVQAPKRPHNREVENEMVRAPDKAGQPPRPATEPPRPSEKRLSTNKRTAKDGARKS